MDLLFRQQRDLLMLSIAFVALNLFDILFTLHQIGNGNAVELNPIMAALIGHSERLSVLYKLIVSSALSGLLVFLSIRMGRYRMARNVLRASVIFITAICCFNIGGLLGAILLY